MSNQATGGPQNQPGGGDTRTLGVGTPVLCWGWIYGTVQSHDPLLMVDLHRFGVKRVAIKDVRVLNN
jgi:hypothetical protein